MLQIKKKTLNQNLLILRYILFFGILFLILHVWNALIFTEMKGQN